MGNACRFFRLSLPGLKMEYKNQLSPFPLLHQPAKEFRGCSLENQNFTFSIKRKNKQRKQNAAVRKKKKKKKERNNKKKKTWPQKKGKNYAIVPWSPNWVFRMTIWSYTKPLSTQNMKKKMWVVPLRIPNVTNLICNGNLKLIKKDYIYVFLRLTPSTRTAYYLVV